MIEQRKLSKQYMVQTLLLSDITQTYCIKLAKWLYSDAHLTPLYIYMTFKETNLLLWFLLTKYIAALIPHGSNVKQISPRVYLE